MPTGPTELGDGGALARGALVSAAHFALSPRRSEEASTSLFFEEEEKRRASTSFFFERKEEKRRSERRSKRSWKRGVAGAGPRAARTVPGDSVGKRQRQQRGRATAMYEP